MQDFDKIIHGMEQAMQFILDQQIPLMFSYYQRCIREGFTEEQAFQLVRDWNRQFKPNSE